MIPRISRAVGVLGVALLGSLRQQEGVSPPGGAFQVGGELYDDEGLPFEPPRFAETTALEHVLYLNRDEVMFVDL